MRLKIGRCCVSVPAYVIEMGSVRLKTDEYSITIEQLADLPESTYILYDISDELSFS